MSEETNQAVPEVMTATKVAQHEAELNAAILAKVKADAPAELVRCAPKCHLMNKEIKPLTIPDMSKRGGIAITDTAATWHYATEATQDDYRVSGPSMTVADIPLDTKDEAEFKSNMLEVARSMAEKCRAGAAREAEYRARTAERAALAAAKADRINNAAKNLPRLKASDLFKAGVLFVPEHGEQPDPEKFGGELLAYVNYSHAPEFRWTLIEWSDGVWQCACEDVNNIECWMLPPSLKD